MNIKSIVPNESIALYVKDILVYNNLNKDVCTVLPFFADGYPGLIYHTALNKMTLLPVGQLMKPFFIYGQTLHPIELIVEGQFQMVIFQLFPFALRTLFDLDAQSLNENCYDLTDSEIATVNKLGGDNSDEHYVNSITEFISAKIKSITKQDDLVKESIRLILESGGTISIKEITVKLNVSERSLQRRFKLQAGISPKKFSKIIQFQASLEQLNNEEYLKLGQIAFENGYADQSHFIRIFRQFTGKTPSSLLK